MSDTVAQRRPTRKGAARISRLAQVDAAGTQTANGQGTAELSVDALHWLTDGGRPPRRYEPPRLQRDLIRRTALLDWFSAHRSEPLVAIFAPPGYGKSTL